MAAIDPEKENIGPRCISKRISKVNGLACGLNQDLTHCDKAALGPKRFTEGILFSGSDYRGFCPKGQGKAASAWLRGLSACNILSGKIHEGHHFTPGSDSLNGRGLRAAVFFDLQKRYFPLRFYSKVLFTVQD